MITISHTAPDGRSSHNLATSPACAALARAGAFYSAWGRIGDAMRAAIYRNSGFVLDPRPPARTGANRKTPGATHSRMSGHPGRPDGGSVATPPAVIPNVPGARNCAASGPPTA